MPLFNQTPGRAIKHTWNRKRWIALNIEIKVSRQSDIKPINNPITGRQWLLPQPGVCCYDISPSQVTDSWADLEINKQSACQSVYLLFSIQLGLQYQASALTVADISAIPPETTGQTPLITIVIFSVRNDQLAGGGYSWSPDCLQHSRPAAALVHISPRFS